MKMMYYSLSMEAPFKFSVVMLVPHWTFLEVRLNRNFVEMLSFFYRS